MRGSSYCSRNRALNAYQTSRTVINGEKGHAREHARVAARVFRAPLLERRRGDHQICENGRSRK